MKKVIETMTLHMNEIEFEKDKRENITGCKSHKISSEVFIKFNAMEYGFISDLKSLFQNIY